MSFSTVAKKSGPILFLASIISLAPSPPNAHSATGKVTQIKSTENKRATPSKAVYTFTHGYPNPKSVGRANEDADLNRAIEAYRFFYPTVSGMAMIKGAEAVGLVDNKVFGLLDAQPRHQVFTANSDTPYATFQLDLSKGPMVIEVPAGPLISLAMDVNQRWVADMGIPGPDAGSGGKHLFLPPETKDAPPEGYHAWKSPSNRLIVAIRSMPENGDVPAAMTRIKTVKVHPLAPPPDWVEPKWTDLSQTPMDTTPLKWEKNLKYWQMLAQAINSGTPIEAYRTQYGELARLGIEKGKPFNPDARMKKILVNAAKTANDQMRVQAFADRRPERLVWSDRKWEWVSPQSEDANFNSKESMDLPTREKWFYQAIVASPAMFKRSPGAGSLYWLGLRDQNGAYLDGGKTYKLTIPQPVPAKLFWSVTAYDADTRSQIKTDQAKAALRSLFELKNLASAPYTELYFGPKAPPGKENQWIKTQPGQGWFSYLRIYGPEAPAFDKTWKPSDFEEVKSGRQTLAE